MSWVKAFWTAVLVSAVLLTVACGKKKDDEKKARPVSAVATATINGQTISVKIEPAVINVTQSLTSQSGYYGSGTANVTADTQVTVENITKKTTDVKSVRTIHSSIDDIGYAQSTMIDEKTFILYQAKCGDAQCSKYYLVVWFGSGETISLVSKITTTDGKSVGYNVPPKHYQDSSMAFSNAILELDKEFNLNYVE